MEAFQLDSAYLNDGRFGLRTFLAYEVAWRSIHSGNHGITMTSICNGNDPYDYFLRILYVVLCDLIACLDDGIDGCVLKELHVLSKLAS